MKHRFGRGAVNELVPEVLRRGYGKALIVTDAQLVACGVVEKVTAKLDAAGLEYQVLIAWCLIPLSPLCSVGWQRLTQVALII